MIAKFLLMLVLVFSTCGANAADKSAVATQVHSGLEYELLGTYDQEKLNRVTGAELDAFMSTSTQPTEYQGKFSPAKYAVQLYRVRYRSVIPEFGNQPTVASGLLAIPVTSEAPCSIKASVPPIPTIQWKPGSCSLASRHKATWW